MGRQQATSHPLLYYIFIHSDVDQLFSSSIHMYLSIYIPRLYFIFWQELALRGPAISTVYKKNKTLTYKCADTGWDTVAPLDFCRSKTLRLTVFTYGFSQRRRLTHSSRPSVGHIAAASLWKQRWPTFEVVLRSRGRTDNCTESILLMHDWKWKMENTSALFDGHEQIQWCTSYLDTLIF